MEHILQSAKKNRKLRYQVKWVRLDHDLEWYNAEGFKGAPHKLKAFHDEYPKAFGPPANLRYWLDCYVDGTELEACTDDNGWVDR